MKEEEKTNQNYLTPYSDEELEIFKKLILQKREQAEKNLNDLQETLKEYSYNADNESTYSQHMADIGSDVYSRGQTYEMANRLTKFIHHLDDALSRIHNKTYGICIVTGKKIKKKRLLLVPHTQHSIEAKN